MQALIVALSAAATAEPDWNALHDPAGWEEVSERTIEIGDVRVARKEIDGMTCLRAEAATRATTDTLMAVLWDVPSAPRWSSNELLVSEVLEPGAEEMVFWQHLDIPGWTLIHDRFWVLRARALREEGVRGYRWSRVDGATFPAVVERAQAVDEGAMEPPVMWGEWRFESTPGPTKVTWRGCQDIGGRVPLWIQVWAAGRSLPAAVADLVHEAERR